MRFVLALLVVLVLGGSALPQTLSTLNGKSVGCAVTGNIVTLNGKTIGTSAGNIGNWNGLNAPTCGAGSQQTSVFIFTAGQPVILNAGQPLIFATGGN